MSECRSEEHIQLWLIALWTVYLVVTGTVAPALWTGLAIGVPAALALAWTALEWRRAVHQRQQMQFEQAFVQSMTSTRGVADVMDDHGLFWRNSLLASALTSAGVSSQLDVHVRESLESDLAGILKHAIHPVYAPEDHFGLILDCLAGAGLLFTFRTATDSGSLAVALAATFWLIGLIVLDVQARRRRMRRNLELPRLVSRGARWLSEWVEWVITDPPERNKAFRRSEFYRQLPWVRAK
ncbi:MAG: hypothetical protein RIE53_00525 [Rhodothermales bacterium]